jgi:uncharacterized protein (DUF302 family)
MQKTGYALSRKLDMGFEEAESRIREKLKEQGFGILTEINMQKTLKERLNVDFRRYKILGACNPPFAHQALSLETEIGLMMPCNIIIYVGDDGKTVVSAIDPVSAMGVVENDKLKETAAQVRDKLMAALMAM